MPCHAVPCYAIQTGVLQACRLQLCRERPSIFKFRAVPASARVFLMQGAAALVLGLCRRRRRLEGACAAGGSLRWLRMRLSGGRPVLHGRPRCSDPFTYMFAAHSFQHPKCLWVHAQAPPSGNQTPSRACCWLRMMLGRRTLACTSDTVPLPCRARDLAPGPGDEGEWRTVFIYRTLSSLHICSTRSRGMQGLSVQGSSVAHGSWLRI